jgi:ATP synthase protein I
MDQQKPREISDEEQPRGDPWHAFGYLVAGVFVYGMIGWALDRWLGTSFLVVIGILFGAGLGIFMTWARFNRPRPPQDETL